MNCKEQITELLLSTGIVGMDNLVKHMEDNGFFTAPASGNYHMAIEGGLAKHSLNVYYLGKESLNFIIGSSGISDNTWIIVSLLHDLGKMGHHNKPNYVKTPLLKSGKEPAKPYETNKALMYIPHEIESLAIASRFIELTEEEEFAILHHNGMYGDLKYQLQGKETPLQMLLHFADMWASRVVEVEHE